MKRITLFAVCAIILISLCAGCAGEKEDVIALSINDIRTDPLSFVGEIALTGINVGLYQPDPTIFFLMDTEELMACLDMQCGVFQLPVIYTGSDPMPDLADEVVIVGSWVKYEEDGQSVDIFGATSIDVKRNIMSILTGGA